MQTANNPHKEQPLDENALRAAIEQASYTVLNIATEPYQKKRIFGLPK